VSRNQASRSWQAKLTTYIVASAIGGTSVGVLLGLLGSTLPDDVRIALVTALAVGGCLYGAAEGLGRYPKLLQRDTETPQRWMDRGPLRWAWLNGGALGLGFTTRLGFALWYVVPASSLLSGSPLLGALIYGVYGLMRGAGALLIIFAARRSNFGTVSGFLLDAKVSAKALAGHILLAISIATLIVAGV
jgi:hypothetical protein